jgi:threonyl-tRNA synthetase
MIHRAIFGAWERFIGILIENFAGNFPLWLAPVQAVVVPIGRDQEAYAAQVAGALTGAGLRAEVDARDEKVGRKIRDAEEQKVPVMLVVGPREVEAEAVALRRHGLGDQGTRSVDEVVAGLASEARERLLEPAAA